MICLDLLSMKLFQSHDLEHGYYELAREALGHFIVSFF
jgi:hypothetical protein